MTCLVCDFGGSSVKYALVSARAEMTHTGKIPAPLASEADFTAAIAALYRRFAPQIDGVALSIPGLIDANSGVHHGSGAYSAILSGKNIPALVSAACGGVNVAVENDGKCGALAEAWHGALADVQDGVVLILGTGIGGGVILGKKIHRGFQFSAGEFSYALTRPAGYSLLSTAMMNGAAFGLTYKSCKYKNLSFECQDAGALLQKFDVLLRDQFPACDSAPAQVKADGRQFFRWQEADDPDAKRIYGEFLSSLAVLVHNIQICIAPERVVIGGGLSAVPHLLADLERELDALYRGCLVPQSARAHVVRSAYLDECNLLGAMYHYIQRWGGESDVS